MKNKNRNSINSAQQRSAAGSPASSKSKTQKPVVLPSVKAVVYANVDLNAIKPDGLTTEMAVKMKSNFDQEVEEALQANDYSRYLGLHPEVYFPLHPLLKRMVRLQAFIEIHQRLTPEQYWDLLIFVWNGEKLIHPNFDLWIRLFEIHPVPPNDHLPETMTVYRGCSGDPGLSWSLSRSSSPNIRRSRS